ncbi:MAG TPA: hypothetical protein VGN72_15910 [Tepidisphaeraceae bacterium]|nr:hypothetical protein [Tepidisphaeraceae bacterium]
MLNFNKAAHCRRFMLLALSLFTAAPIASAHEMDAFSTPAVRTGEAEPQFVDLGPMLDAWMYRVLETAVAKVNEPLRPLVEAGNDPARLAMLQRPDEVVKSVTAALPRSIELINSIERTVASKRLQARFPGQIVAFRAGGPGVYRSAFPWPDLRSITHNVLSSTMLVHGVYIGADKVGHFTDVGVGYYWTYKKALREGATEMGAIQLAVASGTDGMFSEGGLLGLAATGAYSNADLAANFAGMLFYVNLTEAIEVNGQRHKPLMVRDGPYWRLADHVRPGTPLLRPFVTDHWDEALNPNLLDRALRPAILRAVQARAEGILRRYADEDGEPRSYTYFARRQYELSSYFGIDYGHEGGPAELIGMAEAALAVEPGPAIVEMAPPPQEAAVVEVTKRADRVKSKPTRIASHRLR